MARDLKMRHMQHCICCWGVQVGLQEVMLHHLPFPGTLGGLPACGRVWAARRWSLTASAATMFALVGYRVLVVAMLRWTTESVAQASGWWPLATALLVMVGLFAATRLDCHTVVLVAARPRGKSARVDANNPRSSGPQGQVCSILERRAGTCRDS